MKIEYITTDLEFESVENLGPIVKEMGDSIVTQLNQWVGEKYCVSLSGTGSELRFAPEQTLCEFCDTIEKLSESSQALWRRCTKRTADIAFDSGSEPNHLTYELPLNLISRLERLKINIAITIYPIGTHTYEENDEEET